ncbi:MAG: hypothetical protein IJZ86_06270 [Bacteroides sp.]|nr:hypothetical protein [Bacteroides sp.]
MKINILKIALLAFTILKANFLFAQDNIEEEFKYRRSSLYSLLVNHTEQKFANEIKDVFVKLPTPDKYNNHDLSIKVLNIDKKLASGNSKNENPVIATFLSNNQIASRMLAKWFNRDMETGACNMDTVMARGLYNASEFDKILSEKSVRSQALLMDAGEDLIGNTYVLVNDIRYIDKEETGKALGMGLKMFGAILEQTTGISGIEDLGNLAGSMAETLKGFRVKVNTYLYQLEWNEEVQNTFYSNHWGENNYERFNIERNKYKLKYVGKQESSGSTTSFMGVKLDTPTAMVRKACQRALDENIANLQKNFEQFRYRAPLISATPLCAHVGLKENITEDSRFEVLEVREGKDGIQTLERIGVIKPVPDKIWDNRYMAEEEGAPNATLGYTTFEKVSGSDFFPGMLIREITK